MGTVDKGLEAQIRNIEQQDGKPLNEWIAIVKESGLTKHSDIVAMLKSQYGMAHGSAYRVALKAREADGASMVKAFSLFCLHRAVPNQEWMGVDAASLYQKFENVKYRLGKRGKRYHLAYLLTMILLGKMASFTIIARRAFQGIWVNRKALVGNT